MKNHPGDLLPLLYEATADREQWQQFLDRLSEQTRARVACLLGRDETGKSLSLVVQSGADPEGQRQYESYYYAIDEFFAYAQRRGFNYPGSIVPSQAFVSDRELLKTEYCNDFLLKFGMFHECFALFGENGVARATLSLIRGPRDQAFQETELRTLRFLAPHVQRAIQLTERFARLQMESNARQVALDQVGLGVLFLDASGKILGVNEAASRLLERQEGVSVSKGRLKAESPTEDRSLQMAICQSCRTGAGRVGGAGAGLLISRRLPAKPLQLVVSPACTGIAALPSCPTAVVFMDDLSATVRPRHELLKALYGLTPAESRVAFLLLDGKSGEEITVLLGISKNTLKTQVQSIYDKTNVRRQSQLVRLLARLPGTLR